MSRIGKQPVELTSGVKADLKNGLLTVVGSKGKLEQVIPDCIILEMNDKNIVVKKANEEKLSKALHGTFRALIFNMVTGVSVGYKKELDIVGVGYKCQMKGKALGLSLGFSHPVELMPPEGVNVSAPIATHIVIEGVSKQQVGEFAAKVRSIRPPEPYKGKGIRYSGEEVRKKLGKALAK